jgi:hypothetical protein
MPHVNVVLAETVNSVSLGRRSMRFLFAVMALLLLSGCTNVPVGPPSPAPTVTRPTPVPPGNLTTIHTAESFDGTTGLPATWSSDAGNWSVEANGNATSPPNVLRGQGGGARSTLRATGTYQNLEAVVKFRMVEGDEGAGLSFRFAAPGEYRIVRYSPREAGWHYFMVEGGVADKRNEATVFQTISAPVFGQWVDLRVVAQGRHIQAWHGNTLVIDYVEPGEPTAGAAGPFLRGRAVALFDDFEVAPLSAS